MFWTLNAKEFKNMLTQEDFILLDIRTDLERGKYWIIDKNQINVDIYNPQAWEKIMKLDKEKKYLIYCAHWNRSLIVLDFMKNNWFSEAYDLSWWFEAWGKN